MKFLRILKVVRNKYVINQTRNVRFPEFKTDHIVRFHILFAGRVQHVGFRLEIEQLALRLQLTGWIKNLENGNVEMEIQGMENKIRFLLDFMNSLKRIKINKMDKAVIDTLSQEKDFIIL